jgi:uncharacterized RDD family membrane protein YckC
MSSAAGDAQRAAARPHGGAPAPPPAGPQYAGLATRTLAFALDAAIVNGVAIVVATIFGLALSILHLPSGVEHVAVAIGGVLFVLCTVGYFATFWATTGQTPADRLMRIRVRAANADELIPPRRAVVRFGGVVLCAIPLGAGFLPILTNDRRRGLHDRLARTVVVHVAEGPNRVGGRS